MDVRKQKVAWDSRTHPEKVFQSLDMCSKIPEVRSAFWNCQVTKESKNWQQRHTQADEWKEEVQEPCYVWDHFYYVQYLHKQLSAPFSHYISSMQHTLCGNAGKKWFHNEYFKGCIYLHLLVAWKYWNKTERAQESSLSE